MKTSMITAEKDTIISLKMSKWKVPGQKTYKKVKLIPHRVIYIASPFTYKTRLPFLRYIVECKRYKLITQIVAKLLDAQENFVVKKTYICPITQSYHLAKYMKNKNQEFAFWAQIDYNLIRKCDEVWVITLKGWEKSIGVNSEIAYAHNELKLPVRFIDPKGILNGRVL